MSQQNNMMPPARTRLALVLISLAVIALELALMRALSLRFWSHFAAMVISAALLGFGAAGTAVTLLRRHILARPRQWMCGAGLVFALSAAAAWPAAQHVRLDVQFLAWDLSQASGAAAIELIMFVPFLLGGAVICMAMMDRPNRLGGHYAANLIGSGLGAVAAVLLMHVLSTRSLLSVSAAIACAGAAVTVPWRRRFWAVVGVAAALATAAAAVLAPSRIVISPYKMLAQAATWSDTRIIHHDDGPLGRIDVVAGPSIHFAPGLSLQYTGAIAPHVLLIVDGDQTNALYNCKRLEDWAFLDQTTAAAVYHLRQRPRVCVVGAGGGSHIGLALLHQSSEIVALEMNRQIIRAMTGPLANLGGRVYLAPKVRVLNREARGYFAAADEKDKKFDVIQVPPIDAFGASGAGLYAAQESYLYTVESVEAMLATLRPDGVLSITRWARVPPRDELKAFDIAAQALRKRGLDPRRHLAMIRSWATVTVLVFDSPVDSSQAGAVRTFCRERSFDVCYLPGLDIADANRFHLLERPD
ncbi:MAG: hypothetical protein J7M14_05915, partial [Planctomycetes bacterium]|nr:hypothetical protein [Planctomycetota bacterium]